MNIPHYAKSMIDNYRRELNIPTSISDEQIFLKREELRDMEEEDIREAMKYDFELE